MHAHAHSEPPDCHQPQARGAFETLSPVVPWVLVVIGWRVVQRGAVRRERRKEDLETIETISTSVGKIRDDAVTYYTSAPSGADVRAQEWRLKYELQTLAAAIRGLRERNGNKYFDLESELIVFRRSVTGGLFEDADRTPVDHGDAVIQSLWLAARALVDALRDECEKAHRL